MMRRKNKADYLIPSYQRRKEATVKLFKDSCIAVTASGEKLTVSNVRKESKRIGGVAIAPSTFGRNNEIKRLWDDLTGKKYDNYDLSEVKLNLLRKSENDAYAIGVYRKWDRLKLAKYVLVLHRKWREARELYDELYIHHENLQDELSELKKKLDKKIKSN